MLTYLLGIKLKSRPGCHVVAAAVVLALNLPLLRQAEREQGQGQGQVRQGRGDVRQCLCKAWGRADAGNTMAATTATYKFIWPRGMLKLCHQIGINRARDEQAAPPSPHQPLSLLHLCATPGCLPACLPACWIEEQFWFSLSLMLLPFCDSFKMLVGCETTTATTTPTVGSNNNNSMQRQFVCDV